MTITIRPFKNDDDYKLMETIERNVWPDEFETAEEYLHTDSAQEPQHFMQRQLAFVDGQAVGWSIVQFADWWDDPHRFIMDGSVLLEHQGTGVGRALYHYALELLADREVSAWLTWVQEGRPRSLRFFEDRGFKTTLREARSELDLTSFDRQPFAGIFDRMEREGIQLRSITQLRETEPEWERKVWEIRWPIRQDIPVSETLTPVPFEKWKKEKLGSPTFNADGYIVAIAPTGEYVGWSNIETSAGDPEKIYTGVTGIKREWRRKGIATALKLAIIDFATEYGATRIETDNEENNPMYDLNMQLGFTPLPAWLTMKKVLKK